MSEMKSAFERALERAEKLGKLSPEEMRQQKEEEYTPVGRAVADRYLGHGRNAILEEEVGRYSGDEKAIVIQAALSRLVEAISLESDEKAERAIAGVLVLRGEEKIREIGERITGLLGEYREAKREKYEQEREHIERREREVLHQLRISGSAVGDINLKVGDEWARTSQKLLSQFNARLGDLKHELSNLAK